MVIDTEADADEDGYGYDGDLSEAYLSAFPIWYSDIFLSYS